MRISKAISYEAISKLDYLDQLINEQHTSTVKVFLTKKLLIDYDSRMERFCNQSCTVGPHKIPKGINIYISIRALHRDEEYWPDPTKFDPERFDTFYILKNA